MKVVKGGECECEETGAMERSEVDGAVKMEGPQCEASRVRALWR